MKLKIIRPNTVIHCKTKEEAEKLMRELHKSGFKWRDGETLERCRFVSDCNLGTGYCISKEMDLEWAEITYFTNRTAEYGEIIPFSSLIIEEKTYEDGLNEAWAVLSHIQSGELTPSEIEELWGMSSFDFVNHFTKKYTPQEAIAKLEAYEAEKQIKVGDVVEYFTAVSNPHFGIYLSETKEEHWVLTPHCKAPQSLEKKTGWQFKKTGKHIDISSILAEIGKE